MAKQWLPKLFGKQKEIFDCRSRYLLLSGSRKSGKTRGILHRIMRHLWETPGANVAMVAKSMKLAMNSGVWQELWTVVVPEWINSRMVGKHEDPIQITSKDSKGIPCIKTDGVTKTPYFCIRNFYGGESKIFLFSIDNPEEAHIQLKGKTFSMVYISELAMFKSKNIFRNACHTFRMQHLTDMRKGKEEDRYHQFIGDTNPDEVDGVKSWIYQLWYIDRLKENHPQPEVQKNLKLIEMFAHENPHLTDYDIAENELLCDGDQTLIDSWVHGIWGEGKHRKGKHFADIFSRQRHVVGGQDGESGQIDIHQTSSTLYTGWDIGSSTNHAAALMDKWVRHNPFTKREESCWSILDEVISVGEQIMTNEFAYMAYEKLIELEKLYPGRSFELINWSDDTAINTFRATSGTFDSLEVLHATNGRIHLQGCDKKESMMTRVRWIRRLLKEERLFVAAQCEKTIEMFENLRRGDKPSEFVLWDKHKHIFDAISYVIMMESYEELATAFEPQVKQEFEIIQV